MSDENRSSGHGITFLGALQVLFIGLKLANVIDWPWTVVLLPIIIDLALICLLVVLIVITYDRTPHW